MALSRMSPARPLGSRPQASIVASRSGRGARPLGGWADAVARAGRPGSGLDEAAAAGGAAVAVEHAAGEVGAGAHDRAAEAAADAEDQPGDHLLLETAGGGEGLGRGPDALLQHVRAVDRGPQRRGPLLGAGLPAE